MNQRHNPPFVGAPDPELRNSPVVEDTDEEFGIYALEYPERPVCYFNNVAYQSGQFVCAGRGELLRCEEGVWVREGSCDPDNP